jgi:hypothetical protein
LLRRGVPRASGNIYLFFAEFAVIFVAGFGGIIRRRFGLAGTVSLHMGHLTPTPALYAWEMET